MLAPITLDFYGENDEKLASYEISVVRWGVLKKALRLQKSVVDMAAEQALDAIGDFLCELFGNRFTRQALEDGAEVAEIMAAFSQIIKRAQGVLGNG